MPELQHALEIEESKKCIGEGHRRNESQIISPCCGLLVQDIDNTVRFVHRSASDFFNRAKDQIFLTDNGTKYFHRRITLACVKYMSMKELYDPPRGKEISVRRDYPFALYAGEYLHRHHRLVQNLREDQEVLDTVQKFISNDPARSFYNELLFSLNAYPERSLTELDDDARSNIQRYLPTLQPFHLAVYLGNPKLVEKLIDEKIDINAIDPYGKSGLTIAIQSGLDYIAGILLDHGAKFDLSTEKGHVILLYTLEKGYTTIVEQIIGISGPLDERFLKILGFLLMIMFTMVGVLKSFLTSPSNASTAEPPAPDSSLEECMLLLQSAYRGDLDVLEILLKNAIWKSVIASLGADSRAHETRGTNFFWADEESNTPTESSDVYPADYPVGNHARVNNRGISDLGDDSTLHFVEERSDDEMRNDNVDEVNESSRIDNNESESGRAASGNQDPPLDLKAFIRTACFLAVERGRHEVVELLLTHKVPADLRNFQGQPLLHRATAKNNVGLVGLLIEKGAKVNQRDTNGRTALMAYATLERNDVVDELILHDAKLDLTQREGCHELYEAAVFGATDVVQFYLENGISPSITNNFGCTPLHGAAANGHLECVKLLFDKDVEPSPVSDTGVTPRDLVQDGLNHYDYILTGGKHYRAQIMREKLLTPDEKGARKDEIADILHRSGALTSEDLLEEIGSEEFYRRKHRTKWTNNSWWDREYQGTMPYYRHEA
ncbi:ankyrin repeat-containing domain protein [Hypoxylon sp. FL1284]|nr:ankyrin repeat-containing domain protein [Hypoxylon sp. FL1284]